MKDKESETLEAFGGFERRKYHLLWEVYAFAQLTIAMKD